MTKRLCDWDSRYRAEHSVQIQETLVSVELFVFLAPFTDKVGW